ncbi:hypothetical protein RRF57_007203 [Xylaria bambusicola]|uniref:Uncharacterized protein n=1 Tax=Xylaria bambusicola TaxID=326684 RepID=A0AAN7V0A0_9PEZI
MTKEHQIASDYLSMTWIPALNFEWSSISCRVVSCRDVELSSASSLSGKADITAWTTPAQACGNRRPL